MTLLFIHFIPVPGHAQSIQTRPGTSLFSCSGWSLPSRPQFLFLLTIPKQDQAYLSAPCPCCLCQAGASSWSVGTMQTQDCYTWSWPCKFWIFYGSFTIRWGPKSVNDHFRVRQGGREQSVLWGLRRAGQLQPVPQWGGQGAPWTLRPTEGSVLPTEDHTQVQK